MHCVSSVSHLFHHISLAYVSQELHHGPALRPSAAAVDHAHAVALPLRRAEQLQPLRVRRVAIVVVVLVVDGDGVLVDAVVDLAVAVAVGDPARLVGGGRGGGVGGVGIRPRAPAPVHPPRSDRPARWKRSKG